MIEKLYAVLERIKNTSGRTDKESAVAEFKEDTDIRKAFNFLFNDFITTGLDFKKVEKEFNSDIEFVEIHNVLKMMDFLKENNTGTGSVVKTVQKFIRDYAKDENEAGFLKQLFTKTYKAGMTARTVNKAFGEQFIPEFNVQLAHPYDKYADKVKGEFVLTTKLDGNRILAVVDDLGNAKFYTRKGKPIEGLVELETAMKVLANRSILSRQEYNKGFVLDGEVLIENDTKYEDKFAETMKAVRKNGVKTGLVFWAFDILPVEEFYAGESSAKYLAREQVLSSVFANDENHYVKRVNPLYIGSDLDVIPDYLKDVIGQGEEGLMLNTDDTYKCKRHAGILKIKEFKSADGLIVGVYEGKQGTKYEGLLGGLIMKHKAENGEFIEVKVGSGFSDEERQAFWINPDSIMGLVGEYQYFGETTNQKDDGIDLRFATWKGLRFDKNGDDLNYE